MKIEKHTNSSRPGKHRWLQAKVERGELVIRIGIDTLAFAAVNDFESQYHGKVEITDQKIFAADMVNVIERESETGVSMLTGFFDQAIEGTIEDGSLGVRFTDAPLEDKP